jgi:hypothetical protein
LKLRHGTLRNNNSSRFGKFLMIEFDQGYQVCAGKVDTYLLEQSRIVQVMGPAAILQHAHVGAAWAVC